MRKLIVANIMSLDGRYEGPDKNVMLLPMGGCARRIRCCWDGFHTECSEASDRQ